LYLFTDQYPSWLKDHFIMEGTSPLRKGGATKWDQVRERRTATLPHGPASAEALGLWPDAIADGITSSGDDEDAAMTSRLHALLLGKVDVYGDYSGIECADPAVCLPCESISQKMGWEWPEPPIKFTRTCDKGQVQSQVLTCASHQLHQGERCHLGNLMERLPLAGRLHIVASLPEKHASPTERAAAYAEIDNWVEFCVSS
jgi:hypothetical protein